MASALGLDQTGGHLSDYQKDELLPHPSVAHIPIKELNIGKNAATAPSTCHGTAHHGQDGLVGGGPGRCNCHWRCACLASALGLCAGRHLWEQHGSAGKRAPAATSSEQRTPHVGVGQAMHVQRAAYSAQHTRARTHAGTGWFNHVARLLVWPSVHVCT